MNKIITTDYNKIHFFPFLSEFEQLKIKKNSTLGVYKKGESIANTQTTDFFYVITGKLKLSKPHKIKKEAILKLVCEQNFAGLMISFQGQGEQFSMTAIEDNTKVLQIKHQKLWTIIKQNGKVMQEIVKQLSQESLSMANLLSATGQLKLPGKVAYVINYLSENIYKKDEFEMTIKREEMAKLVGVTFESFSRTMAEFKHDKIIEGSSKKIKILSKEVLKTLIEIG